MTEGTRKPGVGLANSPENGAETLPPGYEKAIAELEELERFEKLEQPRPASGHRVRDRVMNRHAELNKATEEDKKKKWDKITANITGNPERVTPPKGFIVFPLENKKNLVQAIREVSAEIREKNYRTESRGRGNRETSARDDMGHN